MTFVNDTFYSEKRQNLQNPRKKVKQTNQVLKFLVHYNLCIDVISIPENIKKYGNIHIVKNLGDSTYLSMIIQASRFVINS